MQQKIHLVGIGGYGMSALARVMSSLGEEISGCDIKESERTRELGELGIPIEIGHDPDHVIGKDLVVMSAAVSADNPEIVEAAKRGVPVVSRAEMLGRLAERYETIAVTGTHGKTTTTSMIAWSLTEAGCDPTVIVGGELRGLGGGGRLGHGKYLVCEADEAYGSFLALWPKVAVLTNIDRDHLDFYGSFERLFDAFGEFISHLPEDGLAVLCRDDPSIMKLASRINSGKVTYGFCPDADFVAFDVRVEGLGSRFELKAHGEHLGSVALGVPGRHNVQNALAAIAVGLWAKVPLATLVKGLDSFTGAGRRCQVIGREAGIMVLDDYAHHPTEITATLAGLREGIGGRLIVIFQPQRFTRTKLLFEEFVRAFDPADLIVLTDIYFTGTGEEPIPGVTAEALSERIAKERGKDVRFVKKTEDIPDQVLPLLRATDVVVTMGAGNIYTVAHSIVDRLRASGEPGGGI